MYVDKRPSSHIPETELGGWWEHDARATCRLRCTNNIYAREVRGGERSLENKHSSESEFGVQRPQSRWKLMEVKAPTCVLDAPALEKLDATR